MLRRVRPVSLRALVGAVLLVVATSCDDGDATPATPAVTGGSVVAVLGIDDACALVPTADVVEATDLTVDEGVPAGDERRRVCTFQVTDGDVGITVGVESGGRFEEKAEASRRSLGVEGEEIDGVGDAALFFFDDEDLPEGVGGALVTVGDVTIDITLQGLDEDEMRRDSVALAELAVGNL